MCPQDVLNVFERREHRVAWITASHEARKIEDHHITSGRRRTPCVGVTVMQAHRLAALVTTCLSIAACTTTQETVGPTVLSSI